MDFKQFNKMNKACSTLEVISDYNTCKKLEMLVKEKIDLPQGIKYECDVKGTFVFYREYSNEEIQAQLEISKANSLKSIASSLLFFKILVIIGIVAGFLWIIILLCSLFK